MDHRFITALRVLTEHQVGFVLIGGLAAVVQGSPVITYDVDLCYDRAQDNLERLATALRALNARLRGPNVPPNLPFQLEAVTLKAGDSFTFETDSGSVDILGVPSGSKGFADLRARAGRFQIADFHVWAAHVDDLIAMKQAAGREKDRAHLYHLEALRDEIERHPGGS